jgi:SAM-dependent methyltransferase
MVSRPLTPVGALVHDAPDFSLIDFLPADVKSVLDIGCGTGRLGGRIRELSPGCRVVGITLSPEEAAAARSRLNEIHVRDLRVENLADLGPFQVVICSHSLGYFHEVERFLSSVRSVLLPEGRLLLAVPNVLAWRTRLQFLLGRFEYVESGALHHGYARFYDRRSIAAMLERNGFEILRRRDEGSFPQPFWRRRLAKLAKAMDRAFLAALPGLFAHEFLIEARVADPTRDKGLH